MRVGVVVALLGALMLSLFPPRVIAQAPERRVALVIGNATYGGGAALRNPVNDARAMGRKLKALGFDVITVENGTQQQMQRAIAQFSQKLQPDAVSLFFYAGHGIQVNGHNYLVPIGARHDPDGWRWKIDATMRFGGFGPWRPEWSILRLPGLGMPFLGVLATEKEEMGWGTRPDEIAHLVPPQGELVALEDRGFMWEEQG